MLYRHLLQKMLFKVPPPPTQCLVCLTGNEKPSFAASIQACAGWTVPGFQGFRCSVIRITFSSNTLSEGVSPIAIFSKLTKA